MPSPITAGLHCLVLLVSACCQTSQDSNFKPFRYVIDSTLGEESFHPDMQRQKRNEYIFDVPLPEYMVDIEVSLTDSSYLQPIKEYFKNLTVPTNISNMQTTISNIHVTTVCLPSGEKSSRCSCEKGYAWPSRVCSDMIPCPSLSLEPALPCGYIQKMPFYGPYCEPQTEDSCGMGEPIVMYMSVRLGIDFLDDLRDSSSVLYQKYKADLEKAFNASYRCLPGFVSATVTGFSPGSVFVKYEVKAGPASASQIDSSNRAVLQVLEPFYQPKPSTFTTEVPYQVNFKVEPLNIFEGDTVTLTCEINSAFHSATWYHLDQIISSGFRRSIEMTVETRRSILKITDVTMEDSGSYKCTFTNGSQSYRLKATETISVFPLHITPNVKDIEVICNSPETQKNSPQLSCCIDGHLPSLIASWNVNGTINITGVSSSSGNCTEYKLKIEESLCPPEKSGTVTTYTCELQTKHGARASQTIRVTYLWKAHVTISSSTNSPVPEGYPFNLTCESDASSFDSISWKIQSGSDTKTVDCDMCIKNSKFPATSVLTVKSATQGWSGTHICTVSQQNLESSANMTIEVISLPLKQNILIDPIAASIPCGKPQALECCLSANTTEDFSVTFVIGQNGFPVGKEKKGNLFCYTYNYTGSDCSKEKELTAYCKFKNHKFENRQGVDSAHIRLHLTPDKQVSCSDRLGTGIERGTLIKPCRELDTPDGFTRGSTTYKCINNSWKVARNDCLSVSINNLLSRAESLVNSPESKAKLPNYLAELKEQIGKELNTINSSPANLDAVVSILDMVSSIPADADELTIQNFLSTVDLIVDDSTTEAWEELNKEKTLKSSLLLQSVENFSLHLRPVNNTIPSVSANTVQLQGTVIQENSNTGYSKGFRSTENLTVNVLIGESEIQTLTQNSTIVSVMYSKLGHILPRNESEYVNGLLITTTVSSNRSQKFEVNMTFAKKNLSLKMPKCVFWNFTLNKHGGDWDTRGCTPTELEDYVICSCSHLTSFSILMSPDKSSQLIFEDYISYVGLAISILSLVICIIIESLVWKYVTNNTTSYMRHVCIVNIAASLLIADVWFIVTASLNDQNQQLSRDICVMATFFIHLFYLCVFFWMLSLGLILFYRLVFILHNTSKTAQKAVAFCLGYVCPFVIAVITIAVTLPRNSYTRKDVCWLNWMDSKALLAFVIPALIIVAMNLSITAVVIIKILRPTIGDRSNRQERNSLFQIGKSVAILTPLLGLTWGFGLATIIKNSHRAFHILFALLNALQGLFILVFGTLWDKKIQEALLKRNSTSKWSSQQSKSSSLILVTPMLAMSYPFSRTFNNLCGKTGKYRVSSSEPSTSSSENTSKAYSLLN
ncbi:PREDICTED: adhesion G protein-coupled receptor F5 [Lepidothrix coronata]|uniref:Adhesion G protein-coupled receptor F5 n=1 Tax=Lepidothrix coronata TaxID=321398 RepID=A0A6J0H2Q7_9PASS|nr:PREDICTED: adhesion G protein-coupled receptor F5 [Lepidothrix coronata]XP_017668577.1 PREDICTED: adhesion G protein-coupled receptor F5 [Lepidothrix coronata]